MLSWFPETVLHPDLTCASSWQVALMKKRMQGAAGGAMTQDSEPSLGQETADPTTPQSPSRDPAADSGASDGEIGVVCVTVVCNRGV